LYVDDLNHDIFFCGIFAGQPNFGMSFVSPSTDRSLIGCYYSDCTSGDGKSTDTPSDLTFEFSQG
jgi:hypothetical protein